MNYPSDSQGVSDLTKMIKEVIKCCVGAVKGYRVFLKPFGSSQSFTTMLGYITKDEGTTLTSIFQILHIDLVVILLIHHHIFSCVRFNYY